VPIVLGLHGCRVPDLLTLHLALDRVCGLGSPTLDDRGPLSRRIAFASGFDQHHSRVEGDANQEEEKKCQQQAGHQSDLDIEGED
jgi:hypothetical protein